ncbi:hypothetical protein ACFQZC_00400 [Streptacidiphilus monticola]
MLSDMQRPQARLDAQRAGRTLNGLYTVRRQDGVGYLEIFVSRATGQDPQNNIRGCATKAIEPQCTVTTLPSGAKLNATQTRRHTIPWSGGSRPSARSTAWNSSNPTGWTLRSTPTLGSLVPIPLG